MEETFMEITSNPPGAPSQLVRGRDLDWLPLDEPGVFVVPKDLKPRT
jgi:hypothetical protein